MRAIKFFVFSLLLVSGFIRVPEARGAERSLKMSDTATVVEGNTLSRLTKNRLGSDALWKEVFDANVAAGLLDESDLSYNTEKGYYVVNLQVGQKILLPSTKEEVAETVSAKTPLVASLPSAPSAVAKVVELTFSPVVIMATPETPRTVSMNEITPEISLPTSFTFYLVLAIVLFLGSATAYLMRPTGKAIDDHSKAEREKVFDAKIKGHLYFKDVSQIVEEGLFTGLVRIDREEQESSDPSEVRLLVNVPMKVVTVMYLGNPWMTYYWISDQSLSVVPIPTAKNYAFYSFKATSQGDYSGVRVPV